jgi:hypothetical protein
MAYWTLKGCGIHHSNTGHQITHMYIIGYFMLRFDLNLIKPILKNVSPPNSGHFRLELKFAEALPEALNFLLYLEYDSSVRVNAFRTVLTDY